MSGHPSLDVLPWMCILPWLVLSVSNADKAFIVICKISTLKRISDLGKVKYPGGGGLHRKGEMTIRMYSLENE